MKKIKVCFYPTCKKETNHFLANLAEVLEKSGEFECSGFMDHVRSKDGLAYKHDVFHFNWFDQCFSLSSFLYRFFILLRVIVSGKRIVWTIHNLESHEKSPAYNKIIRFLLLHFSSSIHVMNEASAKFPMLRRYVHKVRLIPHGDYFDSYPQSNLDVHEKFGIPKQSPIVLFLGAIRPYKNIEVLLDAFDRLQKDSSRNVSLLICGKTSPKEYLNALEQRIKTMNNVYFSPEFVPDEDVEAYLRSAAFLVAPYSYRSALNSGSVLLACSYAKTFVCPNIAGVEDIQKQSNCLYMYHYNDDENHREELKNMLRKAIADFDNGAIAEKEFAAVEYMKKNSWSVNASQWISLYKSNS